MNKKENNSKIRPVLLAVGASMALSLASIPVANAASDNFGTASLQSGYNLADAHTTSTDKADSHDNNAQAEKDKDGKGGETDKSKDDTDGKSTDGKCSAGKCGAGKCGQ